jgi:hypothetical protein
MPSDESPDDDRLDALEARLDRLEHAVDDLRSTVEDLSDDGAATSAAASPDAAPPEDPGPEPEPSSAAATASPNPDAASPSLRDRLQRHATTLGLRSEDWISYVGVGLLLFGLAFLFKYSIDQGWLTPAVRVGFGVLLGSLLLVGGERRATDRPLLQQILFGGSSATFYGTIFAAYQLYGLLSYPVAFGGMVFVTVTTIALALQQDHASTAFIGTAGGLGTPFLLYTQADGGAGLALYTCLVLAGACAVYLYRGWRSLLVLAVGGGWGVLALASEQTPVNALPLWEAVGTQVGVVLAWGLLGGTPLLRTVLRARAPDRWPAASTPASGWIASLTGPHPTISVTASPLLAFACTHALWPGLPDLGWAAGAGLFALLYGGLAGRLRGTALSYYVPFHGFVAALLTTYALGKALDGPALLLTWAVEAALLLVLARRLDHGLLRWTGHALYLVVLGWLHVRFAWEAALSTTPLPTEIIGEGMGLVVLTIALGWVRPRWLHRSYQALLITGGFGWWGHVLLPLPYGSAVFLLVGALSAAGLLLLGRGWGAPVPRYAGHIVFGGLAYQLLLRLHPLSDAALPLFSVGALCELGVLGAALLAAARLRRPLPARLYQGGALLGWLGWSLHELGGLPNGQAYVSVVWGGTATVLLLAGAWRRRPVAQKAGLAVLALFVGKLFFVDLATLSALGRIVLFLGAGGGFLLISYLLPDLGDRVDRSPPAAETAEPRPDD